MKTLVFGRTGQLASELYDLRSDSLGTTVFLNRQDANFESPSTCVNAIFEHRPNLVINLVAFTAVDAAENKSDLAFKVNAYTPGLIARACKDLNVPLIHISSEYVFDGQGHKFWEVSDAPNPLNVYGQSKLLGETLIAATGVRCFILRTSWVFSEFGNNFVKTILKLSRAKEEIDVVADQVGGPTPASAIVSAIFVLAKALVSGHAGGTYHFSGAPAISWAGFAQAIIEIAKVECNVLPVGTDSYPTRAKRPKNSQLSNSKMLAEFNLLQPDWRRELEFIVPRLSVEVNRA